MQLKTSVSFLCLSAWLVQCLCQTLTTGWTRRRQLRRQLRKDRSCGTFAIRRINVAQHHRPSLFLPNHGAPIGRQRRRSTVQMHVLMKLPRMAMKITLPPGRNVIMATAALQKLGWQHRSGQNDITTRTRWTGQKQVRAPQWRRVGNGVTVCAAVAAPSKQQRSGTEVLLALSAFRQHLVIAVLIHRSNPSTRRLTKRTRSI